MFCKEYPVEKELYDFLRQAGKGPLSTVLEIDIFDSNLYIHLRQKRLIQKQIDTRIVIDTFKLKDEKLLIMVSDETMNQISKALSHFFTISEEQMPSVLKELFSNATLHFDGIAVPGEYMILHTVDFRLKDCVLRILDSPFCEDLITFESFQELDEILDKHFFLEDEDRIFLKTMIKGQEKDF